MSARCVLTVLVSVLPVQAQTGITALLGEVERRYNAPKTIQVLFEQSFTGAGRIGRTESGVLYLRKPGKMRWEYHVPDGKLFLSDGQFIYFYSPATGRVEKSSWRESGDLRAPLAFLVGRIDFRRDFREFRSRPDPDGAYIVAAPKSDRAPYSLVEFLVTASRQITRLAVHGHDRSVMEFRLSDERINPPLSDSLFQFRMPPNARLVELGQEAGR